MRKVLAASALLLGSMLFADSFMELPQKETKKLEPNIGYYIDARSGKVLESINVTDGKKVQTNDSVSAKLQKSAHTSAKDEFKPKGYENEAFRIKEEIIELW